MECFKQEIIGNNNFLIYVLTSEDRLDLVTLGMMENNNIQGLLPVYLLQKNDKSILRYDISGLKSLGSFLNGRPDELQLFTVLKSLVDPIIDAGEYMIEESSFVFREDVFFVDNGGKGRFLCLPVEDRVGSDLQEFCRLVISQFEIIQGMEMRFLDRIREYVEKDYFSARGFLQLLEKVELESAVSRPDPCPNGDRIAVLGRSERIHRVEEKKEADIVEMSRRSEGPVILSRNRTEVDADFPVDRADNFREMESEEGEVEEGTLLMGEDETYLLHPYSVRGYLIRESSRERVPIDKNEFYIGKSYQDVDYRISDNPTVSRHHAKIIQRGDRFFIVDTNSKNHTFVNRTKIKSNQEIKLTDGAKIRFSDEEFMFFIEEQEEIDHELAHR